MGNQILPANELVHDLGATMHKNREGTVLALKFSNYHNLLYIYDKPFTSSLVKDVIERVQTKLGISKLYQINENSFCLITDHSGTNLANFVDRIHDVTRFYLSNQNDRPVHVCDKIASINFNEINTPERVLDLCNVALNQETFKDTSYYSSLSMINDNRASYQNQMKMAEEFKENILNHRMRFAFQPIVSSATGKTAHYECLLRITHGNDKIVSVGPYVPIAEDLGFIDIIDENVIEMAAQELANHPNVSLSYNISGLAVDNPIMLTKLLSLLSKGDIGKRSIIEITETALQRDILKSAEFIQAIQETGCKVALDDFGAGNTSFKQLLTLPVDIIKIDGAYIKNILENKDSMLFVKMLLTVTKSFGLKTVGEFVENGEIAKKLIEMGVDYLQGNYFAPALNYRPWLEK